MMQILGDAFAFLGGHWKTSLVVLVTTVLFWPWLRRPMLRLVPLLLTLAIVAHWSVVLLATADRQPDGYILREIAVSATARPFDLGHVMLRQNPGLSGSADERHIRFEREQGEWRVSNVSARRRLRLEYAAATGPSVTFDSTRFPVVAGDVLQFGGSPARTDSIHFVAVDSEARRVNIRIESPGLEPRTYTFQWSLMSLDARTDQASVVAECDAADRTGPALSRGMRNLRAAIVTAGDAVMLQFGGRLECVSGKVATLALPNSPFAAASLHYVPDLGFALVRGRDPAARVQRQSRDIWLANIVHGMRTRMGKRDMVLKSFVAGYTKYSIERAGLSDSAAAFRIVPADKSHRINGTCAGDSSALNVGEFGVPVVSRCKTTPSTGVGWREGITDWAGAAGGTMAMMRWSARTVVDAAATVRTAVWTRVTANPFLWLASALFAGIAITFAANYLRGRNGGTFARAAILEADSAWGVLFRVGFCSLALGIMLVYVAWKVVPQSASAIPLPPWPSLAVWVFAAIAVATARGGGLLDGLIMSGLTALVAVGHVAQVELTLASGELRNLRFADDTTAAIAATAALIILVSQIGPSWLAERMRRLLVPAENSKLPLPTGMVLALSLIAAALLMWFVFGTEAGIAGVLQPSEMVKTLTVLILAATVTLALERDRGPDRHLTGLPRLAPGALARVTVCAGVASVALALRVWLGSRGVLAGSFEVVAIAAGTGVIVIGLRSLRNYFWRSFMLIVALLVVILLVPVVRNDLSPFVVLSATSIVTFAIVLMIHWAAVGSEWLQLSRPQRGPPPDVSRPFYPARPSLVLIPGHLVMRWLKIVTRFAGRLIARPEPWMIGLFAAVATAVWLAGVSALANPREARSSLMSMIGGGFDKPIERLISWIEFNGKTGAVDIIGVQFADVGLQVSRSREVIAASDCGALAKPAAELKADRAKPQVLGATSSLSDGITRPLTAAAGRIAADFIGERCLREGQPNVESAARMPAISNDFVSTWLVFVFGRDGAVGIVLLQCLLLSAMMLAGFLAVKWTPGHLLDRPAASAAGYATIGFAVMLGVQWVISWLNALGVLPVMGQPATFLSHGPSHGLLLGAPAVLTGLCALRLRSAFLLTDPAAKLDVPWGLVRRKRE
jgi:cell division protein FtsW (lipid II flippase)